MKPVAKEFDIVQLHIKEVKQFPLLTTQEEMFLAKAAVNGDKIARDKLLTSNMRFVIKIAKQYLHRGLEFEDLISEGYLGLIEALNRFDVSMGYHFLSYAVWWIRQSILKAIYDKVRPIRLPANRNNELLQIEKIRHTISADGKSEEEELEEIATELGMTKFYVREMLNISREMLSLNKTFGKDSELEIIDTLSASDYKTPEEEALDISLKDEIDDVLDTLDKKSAQVIRMRYGLDDCEEKSLQEIGTKLSLSKERIRQIEKKAIVKLRTDERRKRLEPYAA